MESKPENSIIKKAFAINFDKIDEGYLYPETSCFAENVNKAKAILLNEMKYENCMLRATGEEITYLTIPVIRIKNADIVIFEGKEVARWKIPEIIQERTRISALDKILEDPEIEFCYIHKGNYYRPNSCGYTSFKSEAGIYTKEEAVSHAKSVREISLEVINKNEHNEMIRSKIKDLESRII